MKNKRLACLALLATLPSLTVCKSRQFNQSVARSESTAGETPICLSVMGNGSNFPAHVGPFIALLERNLYPRIVSGSSSASISAAMLRGLLENQSLQTTEVLGAGGVPLTRSQKAALVLASSTRLFETFLFLPAIKSFKETARSMALLARGERFGDGFLTGPDSNFANGPAIVGQAVLAVDFFKNSDFAPVLKETNFQARVKMMQEGWVQKADLMLVSPDEFANTIFRPLEQAKNKERAKEIKKRYFDVFLNHYTENGAASASEVEGLEKHLRRVGIALLTVRDERLTKAFLTVVQKLTPVPFVGSVAETLSKPFYLPSGKTVFSAYNDVSQTLPSGTLIHTTARTVNRNNPRKYLPGFENFYQVYYPAGDFAADLQGKWQALGDGRGFIEFKSGESYQSLLPKQRTVVLGPKSLSHAILASVSEPGAFEGIPIQTSESEIAQNGLPSGDFYLGTYGGWLESISLSTLGRLNACQGVKFLSFISITPFVNNFQRKAFRGVVEGESALDNGTDIPPLEEATADTPFAKLYNTLGYSLRYARGMQGSQGAFAFDFDWDTPSGLPGDDGKRMNVAIQNNRTALMLSSYTAAVPKFKEFDAVEGSAVNLSFGRTFQTPFNLFQSKEELDRATSEF